VSEIFVLDTSSILAFTDEEDGCEEVEQLLDAARKKECFVEISSMSLLEVYYLVLREQGEDKAAELIAIIKSWPVNFVYPDEKILLQAGKLKAFYKLSVADALISATAKLHHATLVHKDPELLALADEVTLMTLPLKVKS